MEKNINWQMRSHYESFLKTLKKEEQETSLLFHLCDTLPNIISWLASYAKTEEEKKFVDECGEQAIKLYQRSLDYNYEKIRQYKESKNESDKSFEYLVMTVDENGNPLCIYHARPYEEIVGDPLYDPNRHAMVMEVKFDADGRPVFSFD